MNKVQRKLHIKQVKNDYGQFYTLVVDKSVIKDGVTLIVFPGKTEENITDALDYVKTLNRVGGSRLVWN